MRAEEEEIMAEARIGEMEMLEEMQMDAEMRQALYGQKTITGAATGLGAAGKALAKFEKAALPILVHILNMLSTVLSWGSQGSCLPRPEFVDCSDRDCRSYIQVFEK